MREDLTDSDLISFFKAKKFPYITFSVLATIGIVLMMSVGQAGLLLIIPDFLRDDLKPYAIGLAQLALMLLPAYSAAKYLPVERKEIFRLSTNFRPIHYFLGIIGLLAIQFLFFGYISLQDMIIPESLSEVYDKLKIQFEELYISILAGEGLFDLIRALIVGAAIPAISEEFLFRGFLQRSLEMKMKPIWAVLISSIIFGIIHFNPINLVPLIVIGVFLGAVAYFTKSLIIPILLHFLNNTISILAIYSEPLDRLSKDMEILALGPALTYFAIGAIVCAIVLIFSRKYSIESGAKNSSASS